jgi:peptidoglycan hydrolase CwlO-like protein
MSRDDIDNIPSIVPSRDREFTPGAAAGSPGKGKTTRGAAPRGNGARGGGKPPVTAGSGTGFLARLLITVALVIAAVACAWAWQLQGQLQQATDALDNYASRIGDLEARLSDTDEGMSQNAAVQAAKIRELDSEVRKLWDNVWKQSKERLGKLEASSKAYSGKIAANEKSLSSLQGKVSSAAEDLAKLKSVSGDLSRLMSSAKSNQAEVERVADTLNSINLDMAKLNRQVTGNTEAIRATDAFRRQVNASINDLEAAIRALQALP